MKRLKIRHCNTHMHTHRRICLIINRKERLRVEAIFSLSSDEFVQEASYVYRKKTMILFALQTCRVSFMPQAQRVCKRESLLQGKI